ncbi:MAG: type IV pilus secretin PilQ [Desulfobacterales bacterium]|nr:type IV pilus secretin PilQ [Desulfobacterales bacterium]
MNYKKHKSSKTMAIAIFLVILLSVFTGCVQNMAAKRDELPPEPKLITEISTSEDPESFNVLVKGNRELTYMSVKQLFPLSVLLYFPETALGNINTNISLESEIVDSITASELTEKGHKSRIKIALKKDVSYKAANKGTGLKISFAKPSKALSPPTLSSSILSSPILFSPILSSSGPTKKPVEKKEEKEEQTVVESKKQTLDKTSEINSKTTTKYTKPAWINRIDFSSEETGKSTIIIGTTRPVEYRIKKVSLQLLQLELLDTRLPDYRKFPLITTRFESAVDRIIPVQTPAMKNTSMLTIEMRESVPYFIEQNDNLLLIHFEASTISPRPLEDAKLPALKKIISQTIHKGKKEENGEVETKIDKEPLAGVAVKKYTGEKIALDFYESDVKNVFRILQEVSGKNFAIDQDVAGKVTLTLNKPVPWDQVLDLVLKMNQLDKVPIGDIIRITTTETLKKEEEFNRARLTAAKKAMEEEAAVEPLITEYIPVNYANATEEILPKIETILSENRGKVSADQRTNIIIITDIAKNIKNAREIIRNLDKVTPQVIIEARIVEATTSFSRAIGTQWGVEGGIQNDDPAAGIGPQRSYDVLGGTYGYDMAMNFPVAASSSIGFNFLRIAGTPLLLNAKLLASESQGDIKIISSPKILTLDNKEATISQGVDYPQLVMDQETRLYSITEKELRLELKVTPHVTPDARISMTIHISKYDIGVLYEAGRSFDTKEAKTELLIDDGDTIVIGGIIKTTKRTGEQGFPWLSKIPLLGWLFKSNEKSDDKEELLIFITPRIVQLEQRDMIR